MNITKQNFRSTLPELEEVIKKADFFCIDCEFTGLSTENNILPYDRPEDAYKKICQNTSGFLLIQLGLTAVWSKTPDEKDLEKIEDTFKYRSYNLYVFPRSWKNSFRCQSTSMTFLAENSFDFGLLFREGISFCTQQEEQNLRERLVEKQKSREILLNSTDPPDLNNHIPIPDDEKDTIERISQTVDDFLSSSENEKIISDCNGFQRKLIYEMIEKRYREKISPSTKTLENNVKVILIERKKSTAEILLEEEEKKRNELIELEDSIGISVVLQKISNSKKLIVGHNMLLDLMFIIRQFFAPLPEDFKDFKKYAHSLFPNIIDTKFMCTSPKFKAEIKSSILGSLVQTLSAEPFSLPTLEPDSNEYSYNIDKNQAHEAGFDSYLTTMAFLGLTKALRTSPKQLNGNNELKPFINRIFLMRIQDISHINLAGNEPSPSRDHVFHVNIPETWKQSDLVYHFRNYGPIFVTWINSSSALISLHNRENSGAVIRTIGSYAGFKVQSLASFRQSLEQRLHASEGSTHAIKRKHNSESTSSEDGGHKEKRLKKATNQSKHMKSTKKTFIENEDW